MLILSLLKFPPKINLNNRNYFADYLCFKSLKGLFIISFYHKLVAKFGKNIPVIIHNFEEYHWTEQANDKTLLTEFLAYYGGN